MCFQPLEYDEIVPDARPSGDFLRLEVAIATLEKYKLSSAGLKDCRGGHDQLSSEAGFHIHVHEHARFQLESRICNRQPVQWPGTCRRKRDFPLLSMYRAKLLRCRRRRCRFDLAGPARLPVEMQTEYE